MTDVDIVKRILEGDSARFETLVDRYLPLVRGLCAGRVRNPSVRDDLVQETFVQGYLQLHRLRDRNRFPSWLAQIAVNKCREYLRSEGRREQREARLAEEPPPPLPDPVNEAVRQEMREWVRARIAALPDKTRDAMMLCYVEGLSAAEAARALRVREGAVKKRLQYGRELVGAQVVEHFGEPGDRPETDALRSRVLAAVPFAAAPWKGAGVVAVGAGIGALLAGKIALLAVPVVAVAAAVSTWAYVSQEPPAPSVKAEALPAPAPQAPATAEPEKRVRANVAVKFKTPDELLNTAPPAPNVHVQLQPILRPDPAKKEAMLREAGAWEQQRRFDSLLQEAGRGNKVDGATVKGLHTDIEQRLQALTARLGRDEMERRYGDAAKHTRSVEIDTDAAGRAEGLLLAPGRYVANLLISADPQNRHYQQGSEATIAADGPEDVVFYVEDTISSIQGTVVDAATGKAPEIISIELSGAAGNLKAATAAAQEGHFSFPPSQTGYGPFTLRFLDNLCTRTRYKPVVVEGVREPGKAMNLSVRLAPLQTVSGRVTDEQGTPLPGVCIMREQASGDGSGEVAKTDAEGRYSFSHDGGVFGLTASGTMVTSEKATLELKPDETVTQDFVLPATGRAVFDIRMPDGSVPGELQHESLFRPSYSRSGSVFVREGDRYAIPYLPAGPYELTFMVAGCEGEVVNFTIEPDLRDVERKIRLRPATTKTLVRVVDLQGRPKADADVSTIFWRTQSDEEGNGGCSSFGVGLGNGKTNGEGEIVFTGLPEGEYEFLSGNETIKAELPSNETLILQVPDAPEDIRPPRAYISNDKLHPVDRKRGNAPLSADGMETFVLTPSNAVTRSYAEVGRNLLFVVKSGYTAAVIPLDITEDMVQEGPAKPLSAPIEVPFGAGGSIFGTVRNAEGDFHASVEVLVWPAEILNRIGPLDVTVETSDNNTVRELGRTLAQGVRTAEDGTFTVRFLPPGQYVFGLESPQLVEVRAGQETGPVDLVQ